MGLSYVDATGRERPARKVRDACAAACRDACSMNFNLDDRKQLHANYWQMTKEKKRQFIGQFVERTDKKRSTVTGVSRRTYSLFYYLPLRNKRFKVCKIFFTNTLGISSRPIRYYFQQQQIDMY